MKKNSILSALLSVAVIMSSTTSVFAAYCGNSSTTYTAAQSNILINGRNVNYVGHSKGSFTNGGNGQWVEANMNNQVTFNFKEINRDEWSVYLIDSSRNVEIQLELHRKKVTYNSAGEQFDLYDITATSSKMLINGRNVNYVGHSKGYFTSRGNGQWVESNMNNQKFNLKEINRDEWSVYLLDSSRNLRIQLDLHRKKVVYRSASQGLYLHGITGAQFKSISNGKNFNQLTLKVKGLFY